MKHKAVLFDLDGTLINTLDDLTDCMNLALQEFGFDLINSEICRPLLGIGLRHLCENCLPEDSRDKTDQLMARFREIYNQNYLVKSAPYDGIVALTDTLYENGVRMAVVTNKNEDISAVMVREVFGDKKFEIVRGAVNGIGCKPEPSVTLEVMHQLGATADETLFVGDGEADVDVAKNAGIKSVWVSWGFRKFEELDGREPNYKVSVPKEILPLIRA